MKLLLLFMIFCTLSSRAQQGTVSNGNNINGINGSVSYTIGQVAYQYQEGTNGSVNQGIQQPYELFVVGVDDFPSIKLEASVAPNPVVDGLYLSINIWLEHLEYILYDELGKIISSKKILDKTTLIEMNNLPPAAYFVEIRQSEQKLKTFKIIKN